jgi:FAD synthase
MKLNISVDVSETSDGFTFTMHHAKKTTTFKLKTLGAGFKKVMDIVEKFQEDNS